MSKDTQSKLISAVIAFIVAILTIFGYQITVVAPAMNSLTTTCAGG